MNKRIKELAKQAGFSSHRDGELYTSKLEHLPITDTIEKFAELIVRECVNTVENLSPGYQDYRNQIEDAFRRDCVEQIKEHFGVEE